MSVTRSAAEPAAESAAEAVWTAWTSGRRLAALPSAVRPRDVAAGVAVQEALRALAGPAYGWKLAATSTAGQAHIGVEGPLIGPLFSRFRHESGDVLASEGMHMRVAEAEFAFVMGTDVAAGASGDELLDAVGALHIALELPDSRFAAFETAGGAQLVADCACAGRFVLGPEVPDWRDLDLSTWPTALWINGVQASSGSGAAVLGDPCTALTWAAADLPRYGRSLRAGEVVTTGTTTPPPPIGPGDAVRADFGALGEITVAFTP
ncbi:2-keto-4-pentenoate hydratase [Pseudonocardia sp. GCM10023141]|uniref:2-keto-4-pentenoate hydratase n=1 Tax=Pseudonocardia sp. GCM10023141 TaxID=3252653 RepID=UPI003618FD19